MTTFKKFCARFFIYHTAISVTLSELSTGTKQQASNGWIHAIGLVVMFLLPGCLNTPRGPIPNRAPISIESRTHAQLLQWTTDPRLAMNELPIKRNPETDEIVKVPSTPLANKRNNYEYLTIKDHWRSQLQVEMPVNKQVKVFSLGDTRWAPIAVNDQPVDLVDELKYSDLKSMQAAGLMTGQLKQQPWSDTYWPLYQGVLGARYADDRFISASDEDWAGYYHFVTDIMSAFKIVTSGNVKDINNLSPAEKYDLLIGDDQQWAFTKANWAEGEFYYQQNGKVETWMGICHGWAPAAYMLPRPERAIRLATANNTTITFYPSDIKGLASYLWANAAGAVRFIGGRCNDKEPELDENGRAIASYCFDTNPGAWHLAIVNQIGVSGRSMVMDATYDYEVWNQPVHSYQYVYFNPKTKKVVPTLKEAMVKRSDFEKTDLFAKYRSSDYTYVVGVSMDVSYMVETWPNHRRYDNPNYDSLNQVNYMYDLELTSDGKIIGGEWYNNYHPDFLWTPTKDAQISTRYDVNLPGSWNGKDRLPDSWARQARKSTSSQQSLPLARIVEALILASQKTN